MGTHNPNMSFALKQCFEVLEIDWTAYPDTGFLNEDIKNYCKKFNPDLVFIHIQKEGIVNIETLTFLSKNAITINWTGDVRDKIPQWMIDASKYITSTSFSNFTDVETCRELGITSDFLQVGYDSDCFTPKQTVFENDIVFMGNNFESHFPLSDYRYKVVNGLKKHYGKRFKVYGSGWPTGISEGHTNDDYKLECSIYQKSKIGINLSHFDYSRYSSDRMFRMMGSGCFCLTHNYKDLKEDFIQGIDLITFDNFDELIKSIDFFLKEEKIRKAIAQNGCEKVIKNFTWHSFAKNLIDLYEKYKSIKAATVVDIDIKNNYDWVNEISNIPTKKIYAQFEEEFIFDYIFKNIGTTNKYLVDFGAGGLGCEISNSKYLLENGWTGLKMDGNPNGDETICQEIITAENIASLFVKYEVPKEFDLLSIDIDGNDFWVLQQILLNGYNPRVIINEFNGCLNEDSCIAIKNNPAHVWAENDYYGASFLAYKKLLSAFDYTLVHQIATTNMIFVKSNLVRKKEYNISYTKQQYHQHFPNGEWVNV